MVDLVPLVVKLFYIDGRLAKEVKAVNVTNPILDIANLESGIYMMKIVADDALIFEKIVKK